jgi:HAD superfamily hydrolase (TIGR01549 family)
MRYEFISFDLQGTLTDSAFSDEFWFEVLPKLYARYKKISLKKAKDNLGKYFNEVGKYDLSYYSADYWLKTLDPELSFNQALKIFDANPFFYPEMKELIKTLASKNNLIISTSTTYDFIDLEMPGEKKYFSHIFSSIDDFGIAGKPKEFYEKVCTALNTDPEKVLHIGDNKEMDIKNAESAGLKTFFFDPEKSRKKIISDLGMFLIK